LHCVCAKLLLSFIGLASFYGEIWWSGNQPYLTMKRGFFYPTLEALWNPRHSQGFSKTIIKPASKTGQVTEWMNDYIPLSASLRSFPCFLILSLCEPLIGSPYGCLGLFVKLGSFFCTGPFGFLLILMTPFY